MSSSSISREQAEQVTARFLRQHYSMIQVEKSVLEDEGRVWSVEVMAFSFDSQKKIKVKVDAMTGSILGIQ